MAQSLLYLISLFYYNQAYNIEPEHLISPVNAYCLIKIKLKKSKPARGVKHL